MYSRICRNIEISGLYFISKEKDIESSLGDFGVRKYDEEIGRFTSIDRPHNCWWEKYLVWSPYHYCANNPMSYVDSNGKDYDVTFEGNTVTISAIYYVNENDKAELDKALNLIMEQSGKYNYEFKDKEYSIVFDLKSELSENPKNSYQGSVCQFDENGNWIDAQTNTNYFISNNDDDKLIGKRKFKKDELTITSKFAIHTRKSHLNNLDINVHEILHSLGLIHKKFGVMKEFTNESLEIYIDFRFKAS